MIEVKSNSSGYSEKFQHAKAKRRAEGTNLPSRFGTNKHDLKRQCIDSFKQKYAQKKDKA